MKFITRAEWNARTPKRRTRGTLADESTCHWNGPTIKVSGRTVWDHSRCASIVRGIQNYHMDGQRWSDIAYNFVVCPHGFIFEGRGLNMHNGANGTTNGNKSSHAIMCLAGEGNPFLNEEKLGYRECVSYVAHHTAAPDSSKGHRDHKSTACPGDVRYSWIRNGMVLTGTGGNSRTSKKDVSMEAALELIKIHYDNARGGGNGSYDVTKSDRRGYQAWVTALLAAHDKGQSLLAVTDKLGGELYQEVQNRKK